MSVTSATFSTAVRLGIRFVELEDEAHVLAPEAGERAVVRRGQVVPAEVDGARVGTPSPPSRLSSVDFPLPDAPSRITSSPA